MRIDKLYIKKFKNLENLLVDLNQKELYTILLGQNATGKSNFLEALIQIFKYLDLEKAHPDKEFDYELSYECRKKNIVVKNIQGKYDFFVNNEKLKSNKDFFSKKDEYLPKHIFTYYSGISNKLKDNFTEHLKRYYLSIIDPNAIILDITEIRRLFYAENIHSNFVLLAFYSFLEIEKNSKKFLKDILGIEDFHSALFVLKKPVWARAKKDNTNFWGATGIVKEFLESLEEKALAPIPNTENVEVSYKSSEKQDRLYLFIKDKKELQILAKSWVERIPFFNALESTYISDLVEDIRVRVKKTKLKREISYRELSEGEQQLLAVLGLLKFTRDEESLILLDEPDTHLNPSWKWKYLEFLKTVVGDDDNKTQILLTTHDPLVIGSLERHQIRIFKTNVEGITSVEQPEVDPKGLGVAGILTSDFFGLPSTLDKETLDLINKRNELIAKRDNQLLTDDEKIQLNEIFQILGQLGINTTDRDPLYQRFLIALSKTEHFKIEKLTENELREQNKVALRIMEELIKQESKE